MVVINMWVKV